MKQKFPGRISKIMLGVLTVFGAQMAVSDTVFNFTTDADFDVGTLNGLDHAAPNNNQLQLGSTGSTFPVLWIANASEDTISKIDTNSNCETARYYSAFSAGAHGAWEGPAPSRTAVDGDGNVYAANRNFHGKPAGVMKILAEGGIDRNNNGVIDTSKDTNGNCRIEPGEMIPNVDMNSDGIVQPGELRDERIAWHVPVGAVNGLGRALCIGTDGNVWLGLFNSRQYYKLNATNGSVMAGPIFTGDNYPYGCLVDSAGTLYSADRGGSGPGQKLGILNTLTNTFVGLTPYHGAGLHYSIALGNGKVYLSDETYGQFRVYNPASNSYSTLPGTDSRGISVDGDGNIVLGRATIQKRKPDGTLVWSVPNPVGFADQRGVLVDANNDIWVVNLNHSNITKFRGTDGAFLATVPVGLHPYTYSDATGFNFRNVTNPSGIWTFVTDSLIADFKWLQASWNSEPQASQPPGSTTRVDVRSANTLAGLSLNSFVPAGNGAALTNTGRFMEVRVTLGPTPEGTSPVFSNLALRGTPPNAPPVAVCTNATINLPANACTAPASVNGGSSDPDGDMLLITQTPAGPYAIGTTNVTLTVTEQAPAPGLSATCQAQVVVRDVTPPTVNAGADVTLEATGPGGASYTVTPTAADGCSPVNVALSPQQTTYPLGTTTVTATATDASNNSATDSVAIKVVDTTKPTYTLGGLCNATLWPPNHKLTSLAKLSAVRDIVDTSVAVAVTVTSNQPINGPGDGNTDPDWNVVNTNGSWEVFVRPERTGTLSTPRNYTVTFTMTDDSGNVNTAVCNAVVPHDQGGNGNPRR